MLKKNPYLVIILLISSCFLNEKQEYYNLTDMKYITRNSIDVSSYLKKELVSKDVIILSYPKYVKESYSLIKFTAKIMDNFDFGGVYLHGLPKMNPEGNINNKLIQHAPLYSYDSFVEMHEYFYKWGINFSSIENASGKLLVLTDVENFDNVREIVAKKYKEEMILSVVMAGTSDTIKLKNLIDNVPTGKNIAAIPLKNWRFPSLTKKYDSIILMGEIGKYKEVKAFDLYDENNFSNAPNDFLEKNKSLFTSSKIKKMNSYLDKVISKENKYLDIKVSSN